jgi:hemolysin activation/secretion protein
MLKPNNNFISLIFYFWIFYPSIVFAQLPPKIEPTEPYIIPVPEVPQEPELDIEEKPTSPQIDNFPPFTVKEFQFIGNTVFSTETLQSIVKPFVGKKVGISELTSIREKLMKAYIESGFITSGVAILLRDNANINLSDAIFKIRIIEGKLGEIKINGSKRLSHYVKQRLNQRGILNTNRLLEDLRFLSDDPLVKSIRGKLTASDVINRSELAVKIVPAKPYIVEVFANNQRSPNVGSFQRGVNGNIFNPLALGDRTSFYISNSNGSDVLQTSYTVPINKQNTALTFQYSYGTNAVIARPVDSLDIKGSSQSYFFGVRHPIFRRATNRNRIEVGLGIGLEHRESQESLLGFNFPISRGSNNEGLTKTSVLNFVADATYRDTIQAASIRSDVRLGIDIDSETGPGFDNGQFLSWRADGQWARKLPWDLTFISRIGLQIADRPLVASEQLSLGGIGTIPGYPQDAYLADNGFYWGFNLSKGFDFGRYGRLSVGPFFYLGRGWGNGEFDEPAQWLMAPGIGLNYEFNQSLYASVSYGFPIFNLGQIRDNLQSDGLLISVSYVF